MLKTSALDSGPHKFVIEVSGSQGRTGSAQRADDHCWNEAPPDVKFACREVQEGDTTIRFRIQNTVGGVATPVDEEYVYEISTFDIDTVAGEDYEARNFQVTIPVGESFTEWFDFDTLQDDIDEVDERFGDRASIIRPLRVGELDNFTHTIYTIRDDDPPPSVSIADATAAEIDGSLEFRVTLSSASGKPIIVDYGTADGTATAAADYDETSGTLTLSPGETAANISVPIMQDGLVEGDENFEITLSNPESVTISDGTATGTIKDSDVASTAILLSASPASVREDAGATAVTVTAMLNEAAREVATTVTVSVAGSGAAGAVDFAAVSNFDIEIAAGQISATGAFTLTPEDDHYDESDETLTVSGASDLPVDSAKVTLIDNDETPTRISLSASPTRVSEGDGATAIEVIGAMVGARAEATTVTVSVAGSGDAEAVGFAAVSNFDIEIAAGDITATGVFTLTPEDDYYDESDERVVVSGTSDLPVDSATVTLADDDQAPTRVSLSASPARASEGDGATEVAVTAAMVGARAEATTVTVSVAGTGGAEAVDFAAVPNFEIEIPAGDITAAGAFTLTPEDDVYDESDERVVVSGTSDLPVESTAVTLADDDDGPTRISLHAVPARVSEDANSTDITVTASFDRGVRPAGTTVTVSVDWSGNLDAVDFVPVADFKIEIPADATSASGTFALRPSDDASDEPDETVTVSGAADLPVSSTTVVIVDDDEMSNGVSLSAVPSRVSEGGGATAVSVTATLDAARSVATAVTVTVSGSGATGAVDFAPVAGFEIEIAAEAISGSGAFTLTPEDDTFDEADETLTVSGASDLPVESAKVTLADDDQAPTRISLFAVPSRVSEGGGAAEVTVTASFDRGVRPAATTVSVSVAGSGDAGAVDFAPVAGFEIEIAAGDASATAAFTLTPEDDAFDERDETVTVSGASDLPVQSAELTLADDDQAPTRISLSAVPSRVSEGGGAAEVTVTASFDRGARPAATTVSVSVAGSGDAGAVDFAPVANFEIEIAAGDASATAAFTLTPEDDAFDERDETVTVSGASDLPVQSAELTLADDDQAPTRISLSAVPSRVSEGGGAAEVTVTASFDRGARPAATTVAVAVAGSGNAGAVDFAPVAGFEIEIAAGDASATGAFTLTPEDDAFDEADETVTVSGASDLPVDSAELALADDDEAPTRISLSAVPSRVSEGGGAAEVTVTAALDRGARPAATTVSVTVSGSGASGAVDFAPVAGFEIEIAAGDASATGAFTLTPEDDAFDETDETVTVSGGSDLPVDSAELTLADDDEAPTRISLSAVPSRVSEGGGAAEVTVTAALDRGARPAATTVAVSVSGSGAADAVDFTPVSAFEIVIPADAASGTGTFTLTPEDDAFDEADETVTVSGASDLPVESATVALADDDQAPTRISLSAVPSRVSEGGGAAEVTVTAAFDRGARPAATTVAVSVAGSGTAGAVDFAPVSKFEIKIGPGETSGSAAFTLIPEDDAFDEIDETVTVSGASDLPVDSAELALADDDQAPTRISLSAVPSRVSEGGGAAEVTVTAALDRGARPTATTVAVTVSGSGASAAVDFAPVSKFEIKIGPGETSGSTAFTLTPEDDAFDEIDETVTVSGASDLPVDSAELALADDDEAPTRISLSAVPSRVSEGGGAAEVTVTAAFDRGARPTVTTVSVTVSGSGASGAVDFAPVAGFEIVIPVNAASGAAAFALVPEDDIVDEVDETVTVSGASDLPVESAEVALADDDETSTRVFLSVAPALVSEGAGTTEVAVTATLDGGARAAATTVAVSVAGSGASGKVGFSPVSPFEIEIPAGDRSADGAFSLSPEDDNVAEDGETLTVSGMSDLPVEPAQVALADDDAASSRIVLSAAPAAIPEDAGETEVAVTAALNGAARASATTVAVAVSGSGADDAVDFAPVAEFEIEIGAGETSGSAAFALTPEDDAFDEIDETVTVSGAADLPVEPAKVTLADDDQAPTRISLSAAPSLVSEGGGAAEVTVTAAFDRGARPTATTVAVSVAGSGAADTVDFAPVAGFEIVIPANAASGSAAFALVPQDDAFDEVDETVTVSGAADLPVEPAELTLADDDQAPTRISLSAVPSRVSEGGGAAEVTVTAAFDRGARPAATTVAVSVAGSGDAGAVDFAPVAGFEIVIPANAASGSASFALTPEDDTVDEIDETVTVSGAADLPVESAELTLADDDQAPTRISLSAVPSRLSEGGGAIEVSVTAAFDRGARPTATTVAVSVAGSGDADAVDFAPVAGFEIVIPANAAGGSAAFALTPEDDDFDEVDETVTVSGASDLPVAPARMTLADDDQAPTGISLSAFPARVSEGGGAAEVTVTAAFDRGARPTATTVAVSVAGSGDADAVDFAPVADFEIVIPANAASGSAAFALTPEDDTVDEVDETVTVSGAAGLPVDPAALTLADDDQAPTRISLSAVPSRVSEGGGAIEVSVTAAFDRGARPAATTVAVSVAGSGTADAVDFAPVAGFEIVIPANAASGSAAFALTPEDDAFDEVDETVTVSGAADLPVDPAALTLADDDQAPTRISLSAAPSRVSEGGGAAEVTVTAAFDRGARPTATTVAVSVAGSGDAGAVDFAPVPDFDIVIPANAASGSASFALTPEDDTVDEVDETVTVSGATGLPVDPAELTLADDDQAPAGISLSAFPARVSEGGGAAEVTVTAAFDRGARPTATTVAVSVAGSGDAGAVDFAPVPDFEIAIPANAASGAGTFTLAPEDDAMVESDERLAVSGAADLPVAPAAVTLADDDEASTRILLFLTVDPPRASEGDGEIRVTVTAAVDKGVRPEETRIAVSVSGGGDPDAVDFDAVAGFEIVIPANAPNGTGTFTVVPEDDLIAEADEILTVSGASDLPVRPATVELLDDDEPSRRILLSADPARVSEGAGPAAVTVTASLDRSPRQKATTVAVSVSGGGDPEAVDFAAVPPFEIEIPAGEHSASAAFTLAPEDDEVAEAGETVTVSGVSDLPVEPAEVALADDDEASSGVLLSAAPAAISEADGATAVTVTATLNGSARPVATKVEVTVSGSGNPEAVDFAPVPPFRIVIPAGKTSASGKFALTPEDDAADEVDETLAVTGRADLPVAPASVSIVDDDRSAARLSVGDASALEGSGALAFRVALSDPSERRVTVRYTTRDAAAPAAAATAGADYEATAGTLTFAPGDTEATIRVALLDDAFDEPDEVFALSLSDPAGAALADAAAIGTIRDDDDRPVLSVADAAGAENAGALTFAVSLATPRETAVTARYATADAARFEDAARAGEDYEAAAGTLTFAPGDTEATIRVAVLDDLLDEADEIFTLTLSDPTGAALGDAAAIGTIRDDDAPPALSIRDAAGGEDAGELAFAVTLAPASGRRVEVAYATSDRTASAGGDYAPASGLLTFEPGEVEAAIRVAVLDDSEDEPDETFAVELADPLGATLLRDAATGTIRDDDVSPPSVSANLPDALLCVGGAPQQVRLADYFAGETLRFAAATSAPEVAAVALSGDLLTVSPVSEGDAEVTVTAANPAGETVATFAARVVADPAELAAVDGVLASVGRGLLNDITSAIDGRFQTAGTRAAGGHPPTPAAFSPGGAGTVAGTAVPRADRGVGGSFGPSHSSWRVPRGSLPPGSEYADPARSRAPFSFSVAEAGSDRSWSVWGRGSTRRFESGRGAAGHDGSQTTFQLGADGRAGDWLGGVLLSRARASADYRFARSADACGGGEGSGMLAADLATVQPYAGRRAGSGWLWATVGAGRGDAVAERCHSGVRSAADLSVRLVAAGGRHALARGGRFELSVVEDVGTVRLETGPGRSPVAGRRVSVGRVRIGLEASGATPPQCPISLTTFAKALARSDWGHGDAGAGLELAAGGRLRDRTRRLAVDAEVHALAAHSAEGRREAGANIAVSILPRTDGTGLRVVVSSRRGPRPAALDRWADIAPWMEPPPLGAARAPRWRANVRLDYGFAAPRGLATPFVEFGGGDRASARLGVRYEIAGGPERLRLEWIVARERHSAVDRKRIGLSIEARF